MYTYLIDHIASTAQLKRAQKPDAVLRYLDSSTPHAILVTDEGLAKPKHDRVLQKVLEYARNGGRVIIGLHFPSFTSMDVFDNFFARCGLPWKRGDYHRTDFGLNEAAGRSVLPAGAGAGSVAFPPSLSIRRCMFRERGRKRRSTCRFLGRGCSRLFSLRSGWMRARRRWWERRWEMGFWHIVGMLMGRWNLLGLFWLCVGFRMGLWA